MEESERKLSAGENVKEKSSIGVTSGTSGELVSCEQAESSRLIKAGGDTGIKSVPNTKSGDHLGSTDQDEIASDISDDDEKLRVLCEPERRQVTLTTVVPVAGRINRHETNRTQIHNCETTELCQTPSVTIATGQRTSKLVGKCSPLPIANSIIIQYNDRYLKSCPGIFRLLQVTLSMICLISLTTSGSGKYESYLLLPLSWHFRVMVFVLVMTILTSLMMLMIYTTGLYSSFPLNWPLLDVVLYGIFTFLYLVGSSLVASAFDFYQKMGTDVPEETIRRLVLSVVVGYMAMFVYMATAIHGYKKWKWLELHQFRRKRLIEADEIA